MAEDAIDQGKRVYDPFKSKEPQAMSRRGFLGRVGALFGLGVATGVGLRSTILAPETTSQPKTAYEILLEKGIRPEEIYIGDFKISKESRGLKLNIRSSTDTFMESIVNWPDELNGVKISENEFVVKNAIFVKGANPDDPTGNKGAKGLWMALLDKQEPRYISKSSATGSLVEAISGGVYQKVIEFNINGLKTDQGEQFKPNQIGLVTPLPKTNQ